MTEYGIYKMAGKRTTPVEDTLYLRNARPNRVIFRYADVRYVLEHRGNRSDSVALPIDAEKDTTIARWMQSGQLERISKESFHKLATRTVDILPNQYLRRAVRNEKAGDLKMTVADGDGSGTLTAIDQKQVHSSVSGNSRPEWAGDLMTTEEELDSDEYSGVTTVTDYPSRHR
jgi:hypothetical protein